MNHVTFGGTFFLALAMVDPLEAQQRPVMPEDVRSLWNAAGAMEGTRPTPAALRWRRQYRPTMEPGVRRGLRSGAGGALRGCS